jgi:hypothetical protein
MKTDYTHIALVLDRSGSMAQIRCDTIGGVNTFLKTQQEAPGECTFTLVQFDSTAIETIVDAQPVKSVAPLTEKTFVPRHNTPLYDAIGQTIDDTGRFLERLDEPIRSSKVIFVIVTDGLENASQLFTALRVRQMIQHQTQVYKWEFVFIGANIDSYAVGQNIGVVRGKTMNFASNSASVDSAFAALSENVLLCRVGKYHDTSFKKEQREAQRAAGAKE